MFRKGLTRLALGGIAGAGAFGVYELATDEKARTAVAPGNHFDFQGFVRFSRTVGNVVITAADYGWALRNVNREEDYSNYKETLREVNLRAAKRLLHVCKENGGLYTKFGQGVANMTHAIPPEFTEQLAPLQDRAKEMPFELARETVESELGKPLFDVFSEFDEKPIGAASLAQVHRAVLRESGEVVAVKVQYPYLQSQTKGDLATMKLVTEFVGFWFPDFSYTWLTPEFEQNMELELDFIQEGRNGQRLAEMFRHRRDVKVPSIDWSLSTRRMLVMEFVDSLKITNVAALESKGINPLEVAATVSAVFGDMIHVHGFVHCDPHPGNLGIIPCERTFLDSFYAKLSAFGYASLIPLTVTAASITAPGSALSIASTVITIAVTAMSGFFSLASTKEARGSSSFGGEFGKPFKLVVLDHGMYRRLTPEFRSSYCLLWKSLLLRDAVNGRKAALRLGVAAEQYDALSMIFTFRSPSSKGRTGQRFTTEERAKMREKYKDVSMGDVNNFLQSLPRDLLFVLRSTNIVRAINLSLGGTSRLRFKIMGESAVRGLLVPNPTEEDFDTFITRNSELPYHGAYNINLPVASEIVDADTVTWFQRFEILRLRSYLYLIDNSWNMLASLVKLMP